MIYFNLIMVKGILLLVFFIVNFFKENDDLVYLWFVYENNGF